MTCLACLACPTQPLVFDRATGDTGQQALGPPVSSVNLEDKSFFLSQLCRLLFVIFIFIFIFISSWGSNRVLSCA